MPFNTWVIMRRWNSISVIRTSLFPVTCRSSIISSDHRSQGSPHYQKPDISRRRNTTIVDVFHPSSSSRITWQANLLVSITPSSSVRALLIIMSTHRTSSRATWVGGRADGLTNRRANGGRTEEALLKLNILGSGRAHYDSHIHPPTYCPSRAAVGDDCNENGSPFSRWFCLSRRYCSHAPSKKPAGSLIRVAHLVLCGAVGLSGCPFELGQTGSISSYFDSFPLWIECFISE